MIVSINLNEERQKDFADMLSKEQRDSARRIMAQQLGQLLTRNRPKTCTGRRARPT